MLVLALDAHECLRTRVFFSVESVTTFALMWKRHHEYHCQLCSFIANQSTDYTSHMARFHKEAPVADLLPCAYCPFVADNIQSYGYHNNCHQLPFAAKCVYCPYLAKDATMLNVHLFGCRYKPRATATVAVAAKSKPATIIAKNVSEGATAAESSFSGSSVTQTSSEESVIISTESDLCRDLVVASHLADCENLIAGMSADVEMTSTDQKVLDDSDNPVSSGPNMDTVVDGGEKRNTDKDSENNQKAALPSVTEMQPARNGSSALNGSDLAANGTTSALNQLGRESIDTQSSAGAVPLRSTCDGEPAEKEGQGPMQSTLVQPKAKDETNKQSKHPQSTSQQRGPQEIVLPTGMKLVVLPTGIKVVTNDSAAKEKTQPHLPSGTQVDVAKLTENSNAKVVKELSSDQPITTHPTVRHCVDQKDDALKKTQSKGVINEEPTISTSIQALDNTTAEQLDKIDESDSIGVEKMAADKKAKVCM